MLQLTYCTQESQEPVPVLLSLHNSVFIWLSSFSLCSFYFKNETKKFSIFKVALVRLGLCLDSNSASNCSPSFHVCSDLPHNHRYRFLGPGPPNLTLRVEPVLFSFLLPGPSTVLGPSEVLINALLNPHDFPRPPRIVFLPHPCLPLGLPVASGSSPVK